MLCCRYPPPAAGRDAAFTIDASRVTFGRGCLGEIGDRAAALAIHRVALFTDPDVARLEIFSTVERALAAAGLDVVVYRDVHIEPTDASFEDAIRFAAAAHADGYVSLGGGSVIDTCKAANLCATYPGPLSRFINAPAGEGRPVPGPLAPHIACPTTSGTGSEVTGIAVFDLASIHAKTGIASAALRPSEALVDPDVTATLPREVVACSGLDVLSHALESFTARSFNARLAPASGPSRPMSQGKNPWSDIGCREALSLLGRYLVRAHRDASDAEAREAVLWAATLAGIAFGNAGVHVPHAMAYAVAGLAHESGFRASGYPRTAGVPHGMSVIVSAPSVFRALAPSHPERFLECARMLGADTRGASENDAGPLLAKRIVTLSSELEMPNGIGGVGYEPRHIDALVAGTLPQQRLLLNSPREITAELLHELFAGALSYTA